MKTELQLEPGTRLFHKTPDEDFTDFTAEEENVVYFATKPSANRNFNSIQITFELVEPLDRPTGYGSHSGWGYIKSPDSAGYWISMPASVAAECLSKRE